MRGEGAPCGRRVPVTAEVARARMRRLEEQKGVSIIGGKRGEQRGCTRRLAPAPYRPRARRVDTAKRRGTTSQSVESRSREPMRRRLTVIGARIHAPALAIVKRKIVSVTLGISRIRDYA